MIAWEYQSLKISHISLSLLLITRNIKQLILILHVLEEVLDKYDEETLDSFGCSLAWGSIHTTGGRVFFHLGSRPMWLGDVWPVRDELYDRVYDGFHGHFRVLDR